MMEFVLKWLEVVRIMVTILQALIRLVEQLLNEIEKRERDQ